MGLFSFIKGQFIEVIEWMENTESIIYQFPAYDHAIKMGAKLIVRESQAAIFLNEGQIADVFGPGTYTLSTQNMPVLTALKSWAHAFNSPFKADVIFVNTANITDQRWGTTNPVIMRDQEFGIIRLRGFGKYAFKVNDPALFMKEVFGTKSHFSPEQISGTLKSIIVSGVSDLLAESRIPIIDFALHYDELSQQGITKFQSQFNAIGLELTIFLIENISLPEDVEKMIDKRSSMNIAGNLDAYMKFQTAEALREAANNPDGGAAGTGVGLGAGMAMGQIAGQMMRPDPVQSQTPSQVPVPPQADHTVPCGSCQHPMSPTAKFCSECGAVRAEKSFCSECGQQLEPGMKFCSGCGTKV
ncbi:SPFH domain-containing protein [Paenibacillus sp. KN14-4R]|uniref:SPFH domain-containing protein n=1 Tax=Paenibacillus sp. KN14-4R TaxID=3445773 RepID=UPI003FA049E7